MTSRRQKLRQNVNIAILTSCTRVVLHPTCKTTFPSPGQVHVCMYVYKYACMYVRTYVCMYVCVVQSVYVGGCMRTYGRVCVCVWVCVCVHVCVCVYADGRSFVGTNECMLNILRTHVSAKEVRYPFVAFSLKTHFYNISIKTIT